MKILFITSSSINGGAQKHIREMFKSLAKKGNEMYLAAPQGWLTDELKWSQNIKIMDCSLKNVRILRNFIKQIKPDIVNTFILSGGCFGVAGWKRDRIGKIFVTVNNPVLYEGISYSKRIIYPKLYKWMCRYASAFLVKSDIVQKEVLNVIQHKLPVLSIKNGIDFSVFDRCQSYPDLRKAWGIDENEIIITNVAALDVRKGQEYLIGAAIRLRKKYPVHLIVVGEGAYRDELIQKIKEYSAGGYIHLLGRRADINSILYNSDIFALPSLHEGLPNSLMEAMAMGLPCVATNVGGVKQLIPDDSFGIVVEAKDEQKLADAIEKLVLSKALRESLGSRAAELMAENYKQENAADELLAIYREY